MDRVVEIVGKVIDLPGGQGLGIRVMASTEWGDKSEIGRSRQHRKGYWVTDNLTLSRLQGFRGCCGRYAQMEGDILRGRRRCEWIVNEVDCEMCMNTGSVGAGWVISRLILPKANSLHGEQVGVRMLSVTSTMRQEQKTSKESNERASRHSGLAPH